MTRLRKPKLLMDWDENRRVVVSPYGTRMVLFKDRAEEVYNAGVKVYNRSLKEKLEKKLRRKLKLK